MGPNPPNVLSLAIISALICRKSGVDGTFSEQLVNSGVGQGPQNADASVGVEVRIWRVVFQTLSATRWVVASTDSHSLRE